MGRKEDNREEVNDALIALENLMARIYRFETTVRPILVRGRWDAGQKIHKRGEYAEMEGTQPPHYSDPTGDDAVFWDAWKTDSSRKTIMAMADALAHWEAMADWLVDLSDTNVVKRAQRTVPDCLACGDPCFGRVRGGFDDKCRMRWERSGRPDRVKFIAEVKAEKNQVTETRSSDENAL